MTLQELTADAFKAGEVIAVPTRAYRVLPVYHLGLVSDERDTRLGLPKVFHSSPVLGGVRETDLGDFMLRSTAPQLFLLGFPGPLSPEKVLERARARLGIPYSAWRYNCEHFVCDAHGLPRESPQLAAYKRRALAVDPDPWGGPRYA